MASPVVETSQSPSPSTNAAIAYELRLRQCLAGGGEPARELKRALRVLNGKLIGCRRSLYPVAAADGGNSTAVRTHHGGVIEKLITELE